MPLRALRNIPTAHCGDLDQISILSALFHYWGYLDVDLGSSCAHDWKIRICPTFLVNGCMTPLPRLHTKLRRRDTQFWPQVEDVFKPLESLMSKLHKSLHDRLKDSPPNDSCGVPLRPEYDYTQFPACFD
jgi:hypothetical protein